MQELRAELIREEDRQRQRLLRDPTQAELARSLGLPRADGRDAHECSRAYRALSLDVSSDTGAQVSRLLAGILRRLRNDLLGLAA
jgi:DNA-directed RNA polymerase specialized sigma subunit